MVPGFRFFRSLRGSCRQETTTTKQIKAGVTEHLTFELTCPSVWPLLQGMVKAAQIAAASDFSPAAKV